MRLYIDLSCLNRPFDDQGQDRIRRETEAIFAILTRIIEGRDALIWSWVLTFENARHPKQDRRDAIGLWEGRAEAVVTVSAKPSRASSANRTAWHPGAGRSTFGISGGWSGGCFADL